MHKLHDQFDPRRMNEYLAAGARARSDAFHASFVVIKEFVLKLLSRKPAGGYRGKSAPGVC